jgi:predicted AlkP superfamily pyrophosphatase or phosphodiesterase
MILRSCLVLCALVATHPLRAAEAVTPKLLVLVVFDQMRGDYLQRWQELFAEGGFARLQKGGAWFTNCHYPYAVTQTGPGHASMLTGCAPDQHGIVMNQWFDRKAALLVNCSESARYKRVPALSATIESETAVGETKTERNTVKERLAGSPDYLLAPTLADALKEATGGKAKVVSLSFKDRSAILPVGKSGDAVYWLDSADGMIVTSTCYRDSVHPWVAEFNKARVPDQWFGKEWVRLRPDLDYEKFSGPDKVEGEGTGYKQGVVFPHPTDGGLKKPGRYYYEALLNSPFGNEMLLELVRRAVVAEKLGQHDVTDLLVVSFSSNDYIGHTWGPDSQEVLDVTLRSDLIVAEFLKLLDKEVGAGKYTLALTADHGICPLPEVTAAKGMPAKRLPLKKMVASIEDHLSAKFNTKAADPNKKARWVETAQPPWIYLNSQFIDDSGLKVADVATEVAKFIGKEDGIYRTFTAADLTVDFPLNDPIGRRMKKSYFPERCGDVAFVQAPYFLADTYLTGTTHGTPHSYDTHVPLIFVGPGVKPGIRPEQVTPQSIATVLAAAAGVKPPKMAAYPAPADIFVAK